MNCQTLFKKDLLRIKATEVLDQLVRIINEKLESFATCKTDHKVLQKMNRILEEFRASDNWRSLFTRLFNLPFRLCMASGLFLDSETAAGTTADSKMALQHPI